MGRINERAAALAAAAFLFLAGCDGTVSADLPLSSSTGIADTSSVQSVALQQQSVPSESLNSSVPQEPPQSSLAVVSPSVQAKDEILGSLRKKLDDASQKRLDKSFLDWLEKQYGQECLLALRDKLSGGTWEKEDWHRLTGNTFIVLWDAYSGAAKNDTVRTVPDTEDNSLVIEITGDVSLADNWKIMPAYDQRNKGLAGILSEPTIAELRSADILLVNSEFTFSERGTPIPKKMYTFRAHPSRVSIYHEMGVDLVSLANNHAFDYGEDAFYDTLDTLKQADIPYMGGGKNLDEAMRPVYFLANGRKIAFVAATRAEKNILTPEAGKDTPGVLRTYNTKRFLEVIRQAREKSDIVIAYVHWGREGSHSLEKEQIKQGREFIDAGADIVVGAHAHVLQGVEFYKGKPLVYNLGNFIFNAKTMDTGILKIHLDQNGGLSYEFVPAVQKDCYTQIVDGTERERILKFMEKISIDTTFGSDGYFKPKK